MKTLIVKSRTALASQNCKYAMSREIKYWMNETEETWIAIIDEKYPERDEEDEKMDALQKALSVEENLKFYQQEVSRLYKQLNDDNLPEILKELSRIQQILTK